MQKQIEKPIVQKKTQIKYFPKYYDPQDHFHIFVLEEQGDANVMVPVPKEQRVVGNYMIAHLDPEDPRNGSETGQTEQAGLMRWLGNQEVNSLLIKGHLLNHDLGGLGISENLFPLTTAANNTHKYAVEIPTKGMLNKAKLNNAAFHKMTPEEKQANQASTEDEKLYPNQAILYTVQVRNNYSFATGVPDEFDCTVKTGYDVQKDNCDTFQQLTEQHRIIKSDLLEKTKSYTNVSVSDINKNYMNGKMSSIKAVSDWERDGSEWSGSRILTPGQGTGELLAGDPTRFSLSPYQLVRRRGYSNTVDKDMGEVTMQVESLESFKAKLEQKYLEGNCIDIIITLMEAYEDSHSNVTQTIVNAKKTLCDRIQIRETDDVNHMLLNFYIRPASIAVDIFAWLIAIHWETVIRRNGLLVSILRERWNELGGDPVILQCVGVAATKVYAELAHDTENGENRFKTYNKKVQDILVQANPSCDFYSTEMKDVKPKRKTIIRYTTKFSTDAIQKLDENGVEALILMEPEAINWIVLAQEFRDNQKYITAYYIYRVLFTYKMLQDHDILLTIFDEIKQTQVPPTSLFELCYEINKGFIIEYFRIICSNVHMQDILIENFTAQQILKFSDSTLFDFLKILRVEFRELARKCIMGLSYMIDVECFRYLFGMGFWDIGDMEDILPQYMRQRILYEKIVLHQSMGGKITQEEVAADKKRYHMISDFLQDALTENPPGAGESFDTYSGRIRGIVNETAKEVLENDYNEVIVMKYINDLFMQYMNIKNLEKEFWDARAGILSESFLLNIKIEDIVNNPLISMDSKINLLNLMITQLLADYGLFEKYFMQIYDVFEASIRYGVGIEIPIVRAFKLMFTSNWPQDIRLARWLGFTYFMCKTPYVGLLTQHTEIAGNIMQLIATEMQLKGNVNHLKSFIHTLCDYEILSGEFYQTCFPFATV